MRLLVTGGAGFIGSNFIRYWLKKYPKDRVVNLDKLTYAGHLSSTQDFAKNKNYTLIKGDICNPKVVSKAMKGVDCVVHFAAESHVDRSILKPKTCTLTNILGTQTLLDAALKEKVRRFHYISTDEIFGALALGSKHKFDQRSLYNPRSPYSASKAAAAHVVRAYFHTYGLPVTTTNASNNYGPYQDPEKFISRMITNLIDGEDIKIYGDGKYVRDWLYVEDHCSAIDKVLKRGKVGETYFVGGQNKEVNNLAVAKKLIKIFGLDNSRIKFVKDRPGHDRRYALDWSKTKKELGWKPKCNLDEWLLATVKWYKENEAWWRPLKKGAEKLYEKTGQK